MHLERELRLAIDGLKSCSEDDLGGRSHISLGSGCELFMKYVTRAFNLEFMALIPVIIFLTIFINHIYIVRVCKFILICVCIYCIFLNNAKYRKFLHVFITGF